MKKKFIDFMGFTDQDILEIKTGFRIILVNVLFTLKIGVPVILSFVLAHYFGYLDIFMYIIFGFMMVGIAMFMIVSLSQTIGHSKFTDKEIVYFERADGSKGSFVKLINEEKRKDDHN
jgi:fatty-acid desaturase